MTIRTSLPLVLLIPVCALASSHKQQDYAHVYAECLRDAGATNNGTVGACSDGASQEAKAEINILYKTLYDRLAAKSPQDAAKLESAQKSWLVYRNLHCQLAGNYVGSPMYTVCPMDLNIQRVKELRELVGE